MSISSVCVLAPLVDYMYEGFGQRSVVNQKGEEELSSKRLIARYSLDYSFEFR